MRARLDNCDICIYDSCNSTQVLISNGAYDKQTGLRYNTNTSETEYIWMRVETSNPEASCVYSLLEIKVPKPSTYVLCVITFETF